MRGVIRRSVTGWLVGWLLLQAGGAMTQETSGDVWNDVEHKYADSNGVKIHYAALSPKGGGSAPLVVMIHGFPDFWYSWRKQMRALADNGYRAAAVDLRGALPTLTTPTLLLHRRDDPWLSVEHSRYVAGRIPGARLVVLPGVDHWPWIGDADAVLTEVEAFVTGHRPSRRERPAWGPESLTHREREVVHLAVRGLSAAEIGARLFISERTVETHVANAYRKLGIGSRIELLRRAVEVGI